MKIISSKASIFFTLCLLVFDNQVLTAVPYCPTDAYSEIELSEAIYQFKSGNYLECETISKNALKNQPNNLVMTELLAVCLQKQNRFMEASQNFDRLIMLAKDKGLSEGKMTSYLIQSGINYYLLGNYKQATHLLQTAKRNKISTEHVNYYLGAIALRQGRQAVSERYFKEAARGRDPRVRLASTDRMGRFTSSHGNKTELYREEILQRRSFLGSKNKTQIHMEQSPLIARTKRHSEPTLRIGTNLGLQYDSNPLQSDTSPQGTFSPSFKYGIVFGTPVDRKFQFSVSYSGFANYITNQNTRENQLVGQSLGLYLTKDAASLSNYGFRTIASHTLNYRNNSYRSYLLSVQLGPYAKINLVDRWVLNIQPSLIVQENYSDNLYSILDKQSGLVPTLSVFAERSSLSRNWNPTFGLKFDYTLNKGQNKEARRVSLIFDNVFLLSSKVLVGFSPLASFTLFPNHMGGSRRDYLLGGILGGRWQFMRNWSAFSSLTIEKNLSNNSRSEYLQGVIKFGIAYQLSLNPALLFRS